MKLKKIFLTILVIFLFVVFNYYNATLVNPIKINAREEVIVSDKIKEDLNGLTVLFFSDLHFGTSINENELKKLVEQINSFDADIVLFGGDLVDNFSNNLLNDEQTSLLTNALKNIDGEYGKFAVYGNHDIDSPLIKDNVTNILTNADFEILENKSVMVRKGGESYIHIIGIDSIMLGNPDIKQAYSKVKDNSFAIALCHTPDIFENIIESKTDLVLAGHSHGGQIYLPFINSFYRPNGCQMYFKGKHTRNNVTLDITNGVGTTKKDIRFLSDAEIVIYKFKSK